ncbi:MULTISPECIES: hypothetical protein [Bacillus cereus group]|uniref:hypothetical protein n=1 Tax=Bacillus cereus group TaxID=86661 RepID=UPI0007B6C0F7|nr:MULTISPECIES: hypothetical protein [Bacillus cereus group]ANC06739.1 hypothetical protein WR47_06495 [Bacillus cereus]ANC12567.1 hypothetical protein WR51_06505 [Bacillus cereus]MDA1993626.1 hypothetical protein [Bacillus cereus]MDA1999964.1 hypothetical protein [Bacillus cereus]MDA3652007.1 hypothetical protein [Bacillus cereus]
MLIKIDDTVIQQIKSKLHSINITSPEVKALNNIATAIKEGFHIISASLDTLEFLYKFDLLEHDSKRMYFSVFSKFTYLSSYEQFCEDCILIKDSSCIFNRTNTVTNKTVFEIPIDYFSHLVSILPTILLSEDMSDCEFYEKIAKKYITENHHKVNAHLKFDLRSGGGSGSYKTYQYEINKGHLVLAISDSDKTYPTDKIGSTLLMLRRTYNSHRHNKITELLELDVREKENLIPPSLYLLCHNVYSKEFLLKLCKIENSHIHQEKLRYIDLKDGITAKSLKTNIERKSYLEGFFYDASDLIACTFEEIDSRDDEFLIMQGIGGNLDKFSTDVLDDGLEKKLAQKKGVSLHTPIPEYVIKELEGNILKKQKLFDELPGYLKADWEKLSKKIISWGCANEPVA